MSQSQGRLEEYYSTAITKGLKAALADASIEGPLSRYSDPHIKANKLMYIATAEKELLDNLQHSWHIYGSDLGDLVPEPASVSSIELSALPPTPVPEDAVSGLSPVQLHDEEEFYKTFRDISLGGFESLEEFLKADRIELLEEFYDEYSIHISDFYDLYSFNLRLQSLFEEHRDGVRVDQISAQEYERVNQFTSAMRDEFLKHDEFRRDNVQELGVELDTDVSDMLLEFLDLVDDVYFYLARAQECDIDGDASHILSELRSFYLNRAWKAVTEVISFHTVRGPRRDSLKKGAKWALEDVDENFDLKFERLVSECIGANIIPSDPEDPNQSLLTPEEALEKIDSSEILRN